MNMNLFPPTIDNTYRGRKAALWILAIICLMKTIQSVNSIFNARAIAISADGIPLETYPSAAADTIVSLFALSAFSRLVIAIVAIIVLVRYRSAVPLVFVLFLLEYLGRTAIRRFVASSSGDAIAASILGFIFPALIVAGLLLSLWGREFHATKDGAHS